jgi:endonuclease YncB( thermonuclease family)
MLRWKKRDEGFEWRQYVRTTIKLRREARREKAEELGRQAAEGARAAGQAAGALAASGAGKIASGAKALGERSGDIAVAGLGLAGLLLGRMAGALARAAAPALDVLGRPGVAGPLALCGVIGIGAGLLRVWLAGRGLDSEAQAALAIGAACLALGIVPAMILGHSRIGPLASLGRGGRLVLAGGGLLLAGAMVLPMLGGRIALPKMPGMPSLPGLSLGGGTVVEGTVSVEAAELLRVGSVLVRLEGVESPDLAQRCQRRGSRSAWPCGEAAEDATQRLVRGKRVRCETGAADAKGVASGRCKAGEIDIAAALVRGGHVFAASGLMAPYSGEEQHAREAKAGLWAGEEPERPEAWRQRLWGEASAKAPDGCPIKGEIRGGKRLYVLPWQARYPRARIDTRRGERWFCSEADAVAAGWTVSGRG